MKRASFLFFAQPVVTRACVPYTYIYVIFITETISYGFVNKDCSFTTACVHLVFIEYGRFVDMYI